MNQLDIALCALCCTYRLYSWAVSLPLARCKRVKQVSQPPAPARPLPMPNPKMKEKIDSKAE
jgi:hypothetical protein